MTEMSPAEILGILEIHLQEETIGIHIETIIDINHAGIMTAEIRETEMLLLAEITVTSRIIDMRDEKHPQIKEQCHIIGRIMVIPKETTLQEILEVAEALMIGDPIDVDY
eukprot:NODE_801_length_4112_cov_0.079990.p5 type:complete len:110 gc:universal NODE_801_length_4112_cov_0.079990:641-312(-)